MDSSGNLRDCRNKLCNLKKIRAKNNNKEDFSRRHAGVEFYWNIINVLFCSFISSVCRIQWKQLRLFPCFAVLLVDDVVAEGISWFPTKLCLSFYFCVPQF